MKTVWIGDLESDGLLAEATVIHCAVFKELKSDRVVKFTPDNIQLLPTFLEQNVEEVIIHNGIQFDIPLIKKVLGYEFDGKVYDTLVLSRMLSPNRRVPRLCPNTSASPHGLESWGWRVGRVSLNMMTGLLTVRLCYIGVQKMYTLMSWYTTSYKMRW